MTLSLTHLGERQEMIYPRTDLSSGAAKREDGGASSLSATIRG